MMCDCSATTVFLNGNNIKVIGDLPFRTVHCRLNADMENPGEREFTSDPMALIREDRGGYLAAVFTIVKAHMAAGCPRPAKEKMRSVLGFEQWSRWVQQPLIWLGQPDPWGKIEDMRTTDPKQEETPTLAGAGGSRSGRGMPLPEGHRSL
jgi:hypothetical protein